MDEYVPITVPVYWVFDDVPEAAVVVVEAVVVVAVVVLTVVEVVTCPDTTW